MTVVSDGRFGGIDECVFLREVGCCFAGHTYASLHSGTTTSRTQSRSVLHFLLINTRRLDGVLHDAESLDSLLPERRVDVSLTMAGEYYCQKFEGRFYREQYLDLHCGWEHGEEVTAFEAAFREEQKEIRKLRLKGLLVAVYFVFLMIFALFARGSGWTGNDGYRTGESLVPKVAP